MACRAIKCPSPVPEDECFCELHRCLVCSEPNVYSFDPLSPGKKGYCNNHKCKTFGCENARVENGLMCSGHTCSVMECYTPAAPISGAAGYHLWCVNHVCGYRGCLKTRLDCFEHKCKAKRCDWRAGESSQYCARHKCTFIGCSSLAKDTQFCRRHQCGWHKSECSSPVIDNNHWTCAKHKCSVDGCGQTQQPTFPNGLCFDHSCSMCGQGFTDNKCQRCKTKCCVSGCENHVVERKGNLFSIPPTDGFCHEHFCVVCLDLITEKCDQHPISSVMKAYNKRLWK